MNHIDLEAMTRQILGVEPKAAAKLPNIERNAIERMIDLFGLVAILDAISDICQGKADWRETSEAAEARSSAKRLAAAARRIGITSDEVRDLLED